MPTARLFTVAAVIDDYEVLDAYLDRLMEMIDTVGGVSILDDRVVKGAAGVNSGFSSINNDDALIRLPMDSYHASWYSREEGIATVILRINKEEYLQAYTTYRSKNDGPSELDLAHSRAFKISAPRNATAEIIGVSGNDFIIQYTTHIDVDGDYPWQR